MNYSYWTTLYESIFAKMYIFLVDKYFFAMFASNFFHGNKQKLQIKPAVHLFIY